MATGFSSFCSVLGICWVADNALYPRTSESGERALFGVRYNIPNCARSSKKKKKNSGDG